jgi:TRAP-type C4-dicarboxylate transport system permease small subunit
MTAQDWARPIYRFGQTVGVVTAVTMVLITVADVGLRYFFNNSIFGGAEVTNAMLGVLVGAGLVIVAGLRNHICVDLFDQTLRRRLPRAYPGWIRVTELLGTLALAALMVRHAIHTIEFGELTAVLEFPIGWVYAVVGALLVAALAVLVSGWRAPAEHESDTP